MTFIDKFDYLNKKFAKKADAKKLTDKFIAVQITLSDEDCGGTLYATFINGAFAFEPYDYHDNTVAIRISSILLEKILTNKADAEAEFKAGKFEAYGNLGHAMQMLNALKESAPAKKTKASKVKKTAVKTVATKKTETPKTVEKKTEVKVEASKKAEKKTEVKVEAPKKTEKKTEVKVETPKKAEKKAEVKVEASEIVEKKADAKPAAKTADAIASSENINKKNNAPKK